MNVLSVKNRRVFIELTYLFIQLKILEIVEPDTFSFTCKDAVDTGGVASVQLFLFLKLLNGEKLSEADKQQINLMLYAAPILVRERVLLPNRFHRVVDTIKRVEDSIEEYGEENFEMLINDVIAPLFKTSILKAMLLPPK